MPCCHGEIDTIRFKPDIDPTNFNTSIYTCFITINFKIILTL